MVSKRSKNSGIARVIAVSLTTVIATAPSTASAQHLAPLPISLTAQAAQSPTPVTLPEMGLPAPQLPIAGATPAADEPRATFAEQLAQWQIQSPREPVTRERGNADARSEVHRPLITETLRRVLLDPTTYAPAAIVYTSLHLDWKSSQPMFRAGYLEAHPGYTINGLPYDIPVNYAEGRRRNRDVALRQLGRSVANNAVSAVVERLLIERAPQHRKLIRAIGWIERTAFASYFSYVLSEQHFDQWQKNKAMARQISAR